MVVMNRSLLRLLLVAAAVTIVAACATEYKAKPLPFRVPTSYPNATQVAGATVAAQAYMDRSEAEQLFGFDIRGAGITPVQVAFDNTGKTPLKINPGQTFLEDKDGQLWPILENRFAYERVTKYAQTHEIFKEGAYTGFLGGVAGALVGAAVGVISGRDLAANIAKGAAAGAAGGAVLGGAGGAANAEDARTKVMDDFRDKSLKNKAIEPGDLSYGFLFFPGEAQSAQQLRLQLIGEGTGDRYTVNLKL
ncbi:MAG: hypothetical protein ACK2UJ_18970 [Candidatus Promineifilaceae bacterium]